MTTLLLEPKQQTIALSMHALRLKATNCRGGTRVSLSRLPAVLQVAPVAPPLLAVIASGLGTPHGSRKQRSHSTPLYTVSWVQGRVRIPDTPRASPYSSSSSSFTVKSDLKTEVGVCADDMSPKERVNNNFEMSDKLSNKRHYCSANDWR